MPIRERETEKKANNKSEEYYVEERTRERDSLSMCEEQSEGRRKPKVPTEKRKACFLFFRLLYIGEKTRGNKK